jgi:hypothetical protein
MARSIADIQADMITAIRADTTLSGLNSASATAVWRLWTFIVASAIWVLEKLFDTHKLAVEMALADLKPHNYKWYVSKAKAFQFGQSLVDDSDVYDNSGLDDGTIAASQIIKEAAAIEQNNILYVKVATRNSAGALEKITTPQYNAFKYYMSEVKDAGVKLECISFDGDKMLITIDCYIDALVLDMNGNRIDGNGAQVVKQAVKVFFETMPFNGQFSKTKLTDYLQTIDGVVSPEVRFILAAKADTVNFQSIDVFYQPYAGYFTIADTDLTINYLVA